MRDLSAWAVPSRGRAAHRRRYAQYIRSGGWFRRREQWAEQADSPTYCYGGCGTVWDVNRDDMHHNTYVRLGDEAHADLWPMCRSCHDDLHTLIASSPSWRKLGFKQANHLAIRTIRARHR